MKGHCVSKWIVKKYEGPSKWIVKKYEGPLCIAFIWLRRGTSEACFKHGNEASNCIKCKEFLDQLRNYQLNQKNFTVIQVAVSPIAEIWYQFPAVPVVSVSCTDACTIRYRTSKALTLQTSKDGLTHIVCYNFKWTGVRILLALSKGCNVSVK
jgi:hypothetical protein